MKRQRRYNPKKVLVASVGVAAVSYVGTTGCGLTTSDDPGTGGTTGSGASGGDTYGSGSYSSGNLAPPPTSGGVDGTGSFSSGNLVPPPAGGALIEGCENEAGGAAGEGGAGGAEECSIK